MALLEQLPIGVDEQQTDLMEVVAVGRRHGLSTYDASYLVLAEQLGASLATLDQRLADAADAAGVRLVIER